MNRHAIRNVAAGTLLLVALSACGGVGTPEEVDGKGDIVNAHPGFIRYLGRGEGPVAPKNYETFTFDVRHTGYDQVLDLVLDPNPNHRYLVDLWTVGATGEVLPSMPFNALSLLDMKNHEAFPEDLACYPEGCVQQRTDAALWDEQAQRYDGIELERPVSFEVHDTKGVRIVLAFLWGHRFQLKVRIARASW